MGEGREGREERRSKGWLGLLELRLRVGSKLVGKTKMKMMMMMIRVMEEGITSMNLMFSGFFALYTNTYYKRMQHFERFRDL